MTKRFRFVAVVLALLAVVALAGGYTVWAQSPSPTPQTPTTPGPQQPKGMWNGGRGMYRGFGSQAELAAVAKALNMTTDQLVAQLRSGKTIADLAQAAGVDLQTVYNAAQAARVTAQKANIEAAVSAGNLSRQKADWMIAGLDKGYYNQGQAFPLGGYSVAQAQRAAIAQALKLTPEQLTVQLWAGKSISDLATAAGVNLTDVQNAAQAARVKAMTDQVNAAVTAGTISQDQGNWLLQGLQAGYLNQGGQGLGGMRGPGGMRGFGGFGGEMHGGRGGHGMGGRFGAPNGNPNTPNPSATPGNSNTSA